MGNTDVSLIGNGKRQEMLLTRSIAFDEESLTEAALAAQAISARPSAETEFLERLKNGEAAAFDLLVTRYSADIYALLCRITGSDEEAADLTQETFIRAIKAVGKFRGDANLKTWLYRIAINESRNRYRWWKRRRRESTISLDAPIGDGETRIHDTLSGNAESPEEATLRAEREAALRMALVDLPEIFREAVILCDIEDLSYEEISKTLGIGIGTVKSRLARGREELRQRLKAY